MGGKKQRSYVVENTCVVCGKVFEWKTKRKTCSEKCRRLKSSQTMSKTNYKYASERQKRNNTMHFPGAREKLKNTLKEMGWKPTVQGGNGKPTPKPVMDMYEQLSKDYETAIELAIPTKQPRGSGYPTCYKVDLAIPEYHLAIEIDGQSHQALERKRQDAKKDAFLDTLDWKVLRFSNKEVENGLMQCMEIVTSTISRLSKRTPIAFKG